MSDFAAFRGGTEGTRSGHGKTAFVFAGGGSFGSIQVGMLRALTAHGVTADIVVGSSVGAMNAAYCVSNPTLEGIEKLAAIWRSLGLSGGGILSFRRKVCGTLSTHTFLIAIWRMPAFRCTWSRPISCPAAL